MKRWNWRAMACVAGAVVIAALVGLWMVGWVHPLLFLWSGGGARELYYLWERRGEIEFVAASAQEEGGFFGVEHHWNFPGFSGGWQADASGWNMGVNLSNWLVLSLAVLLEAPVLLWWRAHRNRVRTAAFPVEAAAEKVAVGTGDA